MIRPASQRTDSQLLDQWRGGDSKAGEHLFGRHYRGVERFFLNKVGLDQVSDLIQQSFTRCLESSDRISDGSRFRS